MKKALTLLLALCMILSVCAFPVSAAVSIPFNSTNIEILDAAQGTIRVSGQIMNDPDPVLENRYVTISIFEAGAQPYELNKEKSMVTVTAGTDGKFSKTFTFTEIGTFKFYVSYEDYSASIDNIEIKGIASAAAVVKNIQNGTIGQGGIATAIANHGQMGVDLTRFPTEFDKNLFEYRIATDRLSINVSGTDVQILESFYALVDKAEAEAAFVKAFNAADYATKYITLMKANAACINGISFAAYDALSDTSKIAVQNSFIGKSYTNADQIKADFDIAVSHQSQPGTPSPGPGPGGPAGGVSDREWPETGETIAPPVVPTTPDVSAAKFSDIANVAWAEEAIVALAEKGIVSGVTETTYNPNGLVTREQFAKLIVLASGKYDEKAVNEFTDIPAGNWSASYVASAKAAGFINGIGDGKFGYGASIKREDMAVMIYNVMKALGTEFDTVKTDFADYDKISDYAKEAVGALTAKGIINGVGDNMFAPKSTATRAQAAVLVYAIIKGVA